MIPYIVGKTQEIKVPNKKGRESTTFFYVVILF